MAMLSHQLARLSSGANDRDARLPRHGLESGAHVWRYRNKQAGTMPPSLFFPAAD
jgi:hypothetical protein